MNRCASVRKKGSRDQCTARPLRGHTLCGRHAKMKVPLLWTSLYTRTTDKTVRVQAVVRGWLIRRRLALAGPGVLCRKGVTNEEDIVTCESNIHPMEYFAFEENGKIWWFSFSSLWSWCRRSHEPVNPYTKTPLSDDTLGRLFSMWGYRRRHQCGIPEESPGFEERLLFRWNILSQVFRANGFSQMHPRSFLTMNKSEYISMFSLLHQDLLVAYSDKDPHRDKIMRFCRRALSSTEMMQPKHYVLQSTYILMILLSIEKRPFKIAFSILSAFYRAF